MAKPSNKEFYNKLRMQKLAGIGSKTVNESKNNGISSLEEYKRTDNSEAYGIVKENHKYYIKKSNRQGNLGVTDFAHIGGNANSSKYQYGSLGEAQKNLNFLLQSINEAFSLGGVYNKLDESTMEAPSLDVKEDIGSFLKKRIQTGKKSIAESTEKKFKERFNTEEKKETKKSSLMNENAIKTIQNALGILNEEAMTTADSEMNSTDSLANHNSAGKDEAQAPINDKNAKAEAEKRTASGGKVTPDKTSGEEDIVSESVSGGDESDPFEGKTEGGSKDTSTADSDQEDGDRVDNESDYEKIDSHDTHYSPESGHKEHKGELSAQKDSDPFDDKTKAGQEKGDIVAESEDLSTADSEINSDGSPTDESDGNIDFDQDEENALEDGTSFKMDDNSIAEDDEDGGEEVAAAADALNDLGVEAPAEEPTPEPEMGGEEAPAEEPTPESSADAAPPEGEMDGAEEPTLEPEIGGEEAPEGDEENDISKQVDELTGKLGAKFDTEEVTDDDVIDAISQLLGHAKEQIGNQEIEKKKELSDKIMKAQSGSEVPAKDSESLETGLNKDAEAVIDSKISDLKGKTEGKMYEEEEEGCSECGTFEQYAESRGYSIDELKESSVVEMANLVSGYASAYDEGMNDGDMQEVAKYMSEAVANEVKEYGHDKYIDEMHEAGVQFGVHEPMVDPTMDEEMNEDASELKKMEDAIKYFEDKIKSQGMVSNARDEEHLAQLKKIHSKMMGEGKEDLENPKKADLNDDGEISDYEAARGKAIEKAMDEVEDSEIKFSNMAEVMGGGVVKPESAEIRYEEVSESENKIRNYVRTKLEEFTGKRKPSLLENKKSDKIKELDRLIETQWKAFNETIKNQLD